MSFNGRTADSGSANWGSNPCTPAPFFAPLLHTLQQFGISQSQLNGIAQQIVGQAQGIVVGVVPLLTSIFDFLFDFIIVAVLSIYLLLDGPRVKHWIGRNMPLVQRERARFIIHAFERVIGGYIRGQLLLSSLIGLLVGVGMTLFGVVIDLKVRRKMSVGRLCVEP